MSLSTKARLGLNFAAGATTSQARPSLRSARRRRSPWDALLVSLALTHGAALVWAPSLGLIALGLWWSSNTIAHQFIHRRFFRRTGLNRAFSLYLSVVLGIPQRLWRERHLAHHAERRWQFRPSGQLLVESLCVGTLWLALTWLAPVFFFGTYLPGWCAGLGLCWLHGYYEHARGTTSHYGALYNWLFFNDGYHVEHHQRPTAHWTQLPQRRWHNARTSRWPAVLRWLELFSLDSLERLVLHSPRLQRLVLASHRMAFDALLPRLQPARSILIVGGGLYPRTALVLRQLVPHARLTILECDAEHIRLAQPFLDSRMELVHGIFPGQEEFHADLVIIPLCFRGDREALYRGQHQTVGRTLLIHDWIWRRRGVGVVISPLLLKRLNVVGGVE